MQETDSGAEENILLLSEPVLGKPLLWGHFNITDIIRSDSNPPAPKVKKNSPIVGFILSPFLFVRDHGLANIPLNIPCDGTLLVPPLVPFPLKLIWKQPR